MSTIGSGPWPKELRSPVQEHHQAKLNEVWPPNPRKLPEREHWIPVWVRVVWEDDGEEWVSGKAARWDRQHVFVWFADPGHRALVAGIWVLPPDVRRRAVPD